MVFREETSRLRVLVCLTVYQYIWMCLKLDVKLPFNSHKISFLKLSYLILLKKLPHQTPRN